MKKSLIKNFIRFSKEALVFLLMLVWVFSGWPRIFDVPPPPYKAFAQQIARPNSDIANPGNWATAPLFSKINEATPDDNETFVVSKQNAAAGDYFEVGLSSLTNPNTTSGHIYRFRARKVLNGARNVRLRVDLYQGTTLIKEGASTGNLTTSWASFSVTLTDSDASNITDYSNLRLRFVPTHSGTGQPSTVGVTWAEFEVPVVSANDPPTVSTNDATSITKTDATGNGNITDTGGGAITERGFVWSTSSQPDPGNVPPGSSGYSGNVSQTGTFGAGTYSLPIGGLSPGTTYFYRAYAQNSEGHGYGEERQFTTQPDLPSVTTGSATNISQNSATGNGNVTNTGGATITSRGFVWDTVSRSNPGNVAPGSSGYASNTGESGSFGTGTFDLPLNGLTSDTTYFYRAYAQNSEGYTYGNEVEFSTLGDLPVINTSSANSITQTSATGNGNITSIGLDSVTERGFVWDTVSRSNPGNVEPGSSGYASNTNETGTFGTGTYNLPLTSLTPDTTYYYRAYAKNSVGYSYGNEVQFNTLDELPVVSTNAATGIQTRQATGNGNITGTGGLEVTERGFVWDTTSRGDPGNVAPGSSGYASSTTQTGSFGTGTFSLTLPNLLPNTTYFFRAYARNSAGYRYGGQLSFTTYNVQYGRPNADITTTGWTTTPLFEKLNEVNPDDSTTEITTANNPVNTTFEVRFSSLSSPIASWGHILRYRMMKTGDRTCTVVAGLYEGGTLIKEGSSETLTGSYATFSIALTTGEASSISNYADLRIRATVDCSGAGAASQVRATWAELEIPESLPLSPPTVATNDAVNIQTFQADGSGNVTNTGNADITERGFVWDVTSKSAPGNVPPESSGYADHTNETGIFGTGSFSLTMFGLEKTTTYFYRAYAKNSEGYAYGSERVFQTFNDVPTVTTNAATSVGADNATGNGTINHIGISTVTERGFVYGTTSLSNPNGAPPETSGYDDFVSQNGSFSAGNFSMLISGLDSDTIYYYRAYAKNDEGFAYGNEVEFQTQGIFAIVTTNTPTGITETQATGQGNITYIGLENPTERGFVWGNDSITSNPGDVPPESSGYPEKVSETGSFGTGTFSLTLSDLIEGTIYFYRAFVLNVAGYSYGGEVTFSTPSVFPTVQTKNATSIQHDQAIGNAEIIDIGSSSVTERGFVWSTISRGHPGNIAPALSGYENNIIQGGTFGTGPFSLTLSDLADDTVYYYRGFAKNSDGYNYGNEVQFTTPLPPLPPTVTDVILNYDDEIVLIGGSATPIYATSTAADPNGWEDLDASSAIAVFYRSGVGDECTPDDNNCYISTNCSLSACEGTSCVLVCRADIQFFAEPTDAGTYAAEEWFAKVSIWDFENQEGSGTSIGVDLLTLLALMVTDAIDYGEMDAGEDTGGVNQITTVTNAGNIGILPRVMGTNMTSPGGGVIPVGNQKFFDEPFNYSLGGTVLSTADQATGLSLSKPVSTTPVEANLFWGLALPSSNLPAADYEGINTFIATSP